MNKINQQNRNKLIDTENRLKAVRGQGVGWLGQKLKGIKQKTPLTDTDNSTRIIRGKGVGEVEEGKEGTHGDERGLTWGGEHIV